MSNVAKFWDAGSGTWKTVDTPKGITGIQGPVGPVATRTSCGGCRFVGTQGAGQPSGVIWDADNFVVGADSVDPNPCMNVSASNELGVLRNTSNTLIQATIKITNGTQINNRSCITIFIMNSVLLGRESFIHGEDTVTVMALAALNLTDKIRVQVYLNSAGPAFAYTCEVTAALTP